MQHLEDGFLHALADGEVPSEELTAVREHLEQCAACRARLDEARMEAETARDLIEFIEVPALTQADGRIGGSADAIESADRRTGGSADTLDRPTDRPTDRRWMRTLAWAATLVIAAGAGYYGRGSAPFAVPAADPMSVAAKLDTVFLDMPADQIRENEAERNAAPAPRPSRPRSVQSAVPAPAEGQAAAGVRQEMDSVAKRRIGEQSARLDEAVVTGTTAAPSAQRKAATAEKDDKKEAESKLGRERAAADSRDQASTANLTRRAAPAAPTVAFAEERLLAKTAADAAAVVVTFPRAMELLGGRIKLIEGMVPARLEATGSVVRVIYVIDEGNLVLAQVSGVDSLMWSLSGPLSADSLGRLRLKVR